MFFAMGRAGIGCQVGRVITGQPVAVQRLRAVKLAPWHVSL
jgi:hypothetical protein